MKQLLLLCLFSALYACSGEPKQPSAPSGTPAATGHPVAVAKVFQADRGWGYDIYLGEKRYIHQPFRPGMSGNDGFATREEAEKVADLVARKVNAGIMPPSVSREEIDSLLKR